MLELQQTVLCADHKYCLSEVCVWPIGWGQSNMEATLKKNWVQKLGYMSRRGHATGIITTYEYTWLLKTDKAGTVWISDAIHFSNGGNSKHASVTEARH